MNCDFIYFLFLKLLQSFCCPRWYEISYILIHSISLFYIYVRTFVNIFNLVIQFFHFVNLHWVVYCFSFLSFSCIFLSRTYYFSVRFYGFNSVFFFFKFFSSIFYSFDFLLYFLRSIFRLLHWLFNDCYCRMASHSSILAWRIPWPESLVGYSPWGHKESDMTEWLKLSLHFHYTFIF